MIETDGKKQFEQETTEGTREYDGFRVVFHPWLNSHKRLWLLCFLFSPVRLLVRSPEDRPEALGW